MNRELRILILEDTPTDAELTERELSKAGIVFTSMRVETRNAFIIALKELHPDIVLSDYKLPDFDGMAALEIVQRDHPEIPVIMVTGALTDIQAVELIHAGARDYVLKDRLERLAPAVQRTLADAQGIRARKQAEIIAERERIRLQTILKTAGDGIHIMDCDGVLIEANDAFLDMLGLDHSAIGKLRIEDWTAQMSWENINARIDDPISNHGKVVFETRHCRSDGVVLDVEINASRIEIEGKSYIYAASRDITERKKAAQALNESLRLMESKEKAKTRFLAAAGHDMRQPIAAANMLVETLKSTSLTPFQSKLIARLDQSMSIFSGMLERLLDISRFDAGLVKPSITSINLDDLLIWLDQNFAKTAADKQLSFRLFFPTSKPLTISTDIVLIQSVLMNLVSNAIKFTERGSILVSARLRGDKVLVQVWDTGIGIAEAELSHIFDEFYQVANPQRSRDGGLGLGLSICQRTMSVLGSKITCRSRPGSGSVFQFYLPLNNQAHEIEQLPVNIMPTNTASNEAVFKGKNIVLVEDDVLVAEAMIDLLEVMGGNVLCFHNAEDALADANIEYADYYIVDYMLGGEHNGIQFLNMLRQKLDKPIKAVMITGDTSTDFIRKAEIFDWPVVHKPVNMSKLISSLSAHSR